MFAAADYVDKNGITGRTWKGTPARVDVKQVALLPTNFESCRCKSGQQNTSCLRVKLAKSPPRARNSQRHLSRARVRCRGGPILGGTACVEPARRVSLQPKRRAAGHVSRCIGTSQPDVVLLWP